MMVMTVPESVRPVPPAAARLAALGLASLLWLGFLASGVRSQEARELQLYQQRLEAWFERLDRNDDGRLTPAETRGTPYLRINFERLDKGGRGYLLPSDLAPASQHFVGDRLRSKLLRIDRNGDGKITQAEAAAFPWLADRFGEADRNDDGAVTLEELWELRRSLAPRR